MRKKKLNKHNIIKALDTVYDNALEGLMASASVEELKEDYLSKSKNKEEAVDSLIRWSTAKSSISGFVSSVGGAITLPVAIPLDMTACLYIQLRMIAGIAAISGLEPRSDKIKTAVYACLLGASAREALAQAGIKMSQKLTQKAISSVSREVLTQINKTIGFRLVTKFGSKGVLNLGRLIPVVSGVVGGSINGFWCRSSGKAAKKLFFKKSAA